MNGKTWHGVEAIVPNQACEALEFGMNEAGALGTEANELHEAVRITGYFERPVNEQKTRAAIVEALRIYGFPSTALVELNTFEIADRDWLEEWKKHWQPVEVGRFIIAPPWIESARPTASDRIIVRINPGMAFGTGTHETTRLCLKAIEKHFRGGSFLDVGTGTGVLAIAAAKLHPDEQIQALDTDAEAIDIARENARLNDLSDRIDFRVATVDEHTPSADLVCANLTALVIIQLLPLLLNATCGHLILSGILDSQLELVESRLSELGARDLEVEQDGEWIALIV
jgi:ribosomal protein L11 methyltransferase